MGCLEKVVENEHNVSSVMFHLVIFMIPILLDNKS